MSFFFFFFNSKLESRKVLNAVLREYAKTNPEMRMVTIYQSLMSLFGLLSSPIKEVTISDPNTKKIRKP